MNYKFTFIVNFEQEDQGQRQESIDSLFEELKETIQDSLDLDAEDYVAGSVELE